MMRSRSDNRGFTLLELLLSMSLLAVLMALVYTGIRSANRSTEKGQDILEHTNRVRTAHQFIRRQFNRMLPLSFAQDDEERTVFTGEPGRIQFVAQMPGYLGFGGPQVQSIEIAPGDNGEQIEFRHAVLQNYEEGQLYDTDPILLLQEVSNASFSFIGRDEDGELGEWTSQWDEPEQLPIAVRLDLELNNNLHISWPVLAAEIRIEPNFFSRQSRVAERVRIMNNRQREATLE